MRLRLRVSPEAHAQARRAASWWRRNRPAAPRLFRNELAAALVLITDAPDAGVPYPASDVPNVRRVLLQRTQYHVYYFAAPEAGELLVVAIWSAMRGRPPPLRAT